MAELRYSLAESLQVDLKIFFCVLSAFSHPDSKLSPCFTNVQGYCDGSQVFGIFSFDKDGCWSSKVLASLGFFFRAML